MFERKFAVRTGRSRRIPRRKPGGPRKAGTKIGSCVRELPAAVWTIGDDCEAFKMTKRFPGNSLPSTKLLLQWFMDELISLMEFKIFSNFSVSVAYED